MQTKDKYKLSRICIILGAAFDYFISIAVSGVYLAKITAYIGISDTLTGIISSFLSLGCGFQILAIFVAHKRPVKRWVAPLYIASEALFAFLYFIPLFDISKTVKSVLFVAMILSAYVVKNVINSPKSNWHISLVDDHSRGSFTANTEIVSLISGIVFSYFMGALIDKFEAENNMRGAFVAGGITLFIIMVLFSATIIFTKEKPTEEAETAEKRSVLDEMKSVLSNKKLFKVVLLLIMWAVVSHIVSPFMGTYQTKELGFTTTFASVIAIVGSLTRALCSRPIGKFADKFSFAKMLIICYSAEILAFGVAIFIMPSNGGVLYFIYAMLGAVGMAGINSAGTNLIFDYVDERHRVSALAVSQTLSGFAGFFTTLFVSPLVSYIQNNGNKIFGVSLYAQQALAVITFVGMCGTMVYLLTVVARMKKDDNA